MVTNAWADRVEAVQTDFGNGVLLRDNTFQVSTEVPPAHACGRPWLEVWWAALGAGLIINLYFTNLVAA